MKAKRLFLFAAALLVSFACQKIAPEKTVQVELSLDNTSIQPCLVSYITDGGDSGSGALTALGSDKLSGTFKVSGSATSLWCFTGELGNIFSLPSSLVKDNPSTSARTGEMVFCTTTILLGREPVTGTIRPLTAGVVLDIFDTGGKLAGRPFSAVKLTSSGTAALTADIKIYPEESRIGELSNSSSSISFDCSGGAFKVGSSSAPASLGAMVLPSAFKGTVTVECEGGVKATFTVDQTLKAGVVNHISLDMANAEVEGLKHMPTRLGILGDSISTFNGIIPSDHRPYYPSTNSACADVTSWEKTYWGHLVKDYWKCELDVNSSWSGSCVADGDPTVVRTPFVKRCSLFKNPDVIILFGGTNDSQPARQIALGEFDFNSAPEALNKHARFRESYIWVIKTLQKNYPDAQLICIVGNHIDGEYGNSVKTIAEHFNLPVVDFRGDQKVTVYSELHPNAAGHAYMAEKIYKETLSLFK